MKKDIPINEQNKLFCKYYVEEFDIGRSYMKAYPHVKKKDTASAAGCRLLKKVKIQDYIKELNEDVAKTVGLSRISILKRLKSIAFSSASDVFETWLTRKEFNALDQKTKNSISEISTSVRKQKDGEDIIEVEYVKVKFHDPLKAIEIINKILGYNEAEKYKKVGNPDIHIHTSEPKSVESLLKKLDEE